MDVGYTVMCVALLLAVMGHVLFGDFEVTMITLPDSISGWCTAHVKLLMITHLPPELGHMFVHASVFCWGSRHTCQK